MATIFQKLQRISPYIYPIYSFLVENLNSNPLLKKFFDENSKCPRHRDRHEHFRYISQEIVGNNPIDYLEFGVYRGDSIKEWANLNQSPERRFYGFDTFTGLPENWTYSIKKGQFNIDGAIPMIKDGRVELIKGLFQDTLRPFLRKFTRKNRMVIHLDADLFSSTLYVLTNFDFVLKKNDVILFDEFSSITGEFKAFMEYSEAFYRKFIMISKVPNNGWICDQVAFLVD